MVSSSKKKRGKQRKAAKSQAEDTKDLHLIHLCELDGRTLVEKTQHKKCAKLVQMGDNNATNAIKDLMGTELCCPGTNSIVKHVHDIQRLEFGAPLSSPNDDGTYTFVNISIVHSGILTTVLNFLKRCEDETFHQVMNSVGKGNLISPLAWIRILSRAEELEPSCSLQIAQNIGPMVRCMCADTTRNFFNSNKHWREGITQFVLLVLGMIDKSIQTTDREVANALLQHEGLLPSIVQWGFWKDHRPDIVRVLGVEECSVISDLGMQLVRLLVDESYQRRNNITLELAADCTRLMRSIGMTSIISREYDPNCMISYTAGYIHRMKTEGLRIPNDMMNLQILVTDVDCVDKGIITALIDFGSNFASDFTTAALVASVTNRSLQQNNGTRMVHKVNANDTRIAFAIRAGLVEMCLNFIEQFGRDDFFDECQNSLENIFTTIHTVSLHQKTAKAISSKKIEIQGALARLEKKGKVKRALAGITNDMNERVQLLDMVRSILNLNGSYCCRCNKSLSKTEVNQCNGCNRMTYCSRACQKEDWPNGHKLTCNKPCAYDNIGQLQGRVIPLTIPENERTSIKLEDLEKNLTMVQLKLFLENTETILNQAISLDVDLCDCVVKFDLRHCPPIIKTVKYSENDWTGSTEFEKSRSKDNITCIYHSRLLLGEYEHDDLVMQRLFPHEWLK
jgi:hypothetical protein